MIASAKSRSVYRERNLTMQTLAKDAIRSGLLAEDLDSHLLRASMVAIFAFFGY